MQRRKGAAIPAAPRKTLLEWIENDDGNTTGPPQPSCSKQAQAIHVQIILDPGSQRDETVEPIQSPASLRLPPLG